MENTINWQPTTKEDIRIKYSSKQRNHPVPSFPTYQQVFSYNRPFEPDLSIFDALFNLGPETELYLKEIQKLMNP